MIPFFALLPPPAMSAPGETTRDQKTLAPSVIFIQERTPEGVPGGPLLVNIVRIAPDAPGITISAALGQDRVWGLDPTAGRESVASLGARRGALAAVNAGFFPFLGNPIGLHVEEGELVTEPTLERSSLVISENGKAAVRAFRWAGFVEAGAERKPLNGLNRKTGKGNELLLFTPKFFGRTLKTPGRFEAILDGAPIPLRPGAAFAGSVKAVFEGGDAPLEPGTVVVSAGGSLADWLRAKAVVGAKLTTSLDISVARGEPLDVNSIRHAVTGAGRLLVGGLVDLQLDAEHLKADFSTTRHPRTAAGIASDGTVLLVTVDGRQAGLSRGMTLTELALLLQRLGAVDALNLDGGGSTEMALWGGIVNSPSDGKERPVADMLVVTGSPGTPVEKPLPLGGPSHALAVGEAFYFLPQGDAVWSVLGSAGFIDQRGAFRALRPGKTIIRVRSESGRVSEFELTVAAPPILRQ